MRVEAPDPPEFKLMLGGLMEAASPVGVTEVEKSIIPVKPVTLSTAIDEVSEFPA